MKKINGSKILSVLFCFVMLISCLYVPVVVSAAPTISVVEDETMIFDFSDSAYTTTDNNNEMNSTGVGFYGWGAEKTNVGNDHFICQCT